MTPPASMKRLRFFGPRSVSCTPVKLITPPVSRRVNRDAELVKRAAMG